MKRVGFSLWKGLWLIFVQTDIKICSSVPSPCLQSDPQINTSDLIKFEASYKFYLSWQNKKRFISSVAFTLYCDGLRSVWWDQYCGSGAHTTMQRNDYGDYASDFPDKTLYSVIKLMSRNSKSVKKPP